ncbi:MAG: response regulator transcription factor [Lachnospiraceae bacterium]|nr:response regulator transcription factor [Lachnospiraceae bacterium]
MLKILVAEDEEAIGNLIKKNLIKAGYQCLLAADGVMAADMMMNESFDLVLLDVMLPGIDGYELLDYAKKLGFPVIFLTALGSTEHKVKGLKMGADDYMAKPFEIVELLARVEAVLRRYNKVSTIMEVHDIVIDTASRTVKRGEEEIGLTMKEFDLLLLLARNQNIALYRDVIYENVWGGEFLEQSRTVDLHIQRLKKKLQWEDKISTVYKVGYRLDV